MLKLYLYLIFRESVSLEFVAMSFIKLRLFYLLFEVALMFVLQFGRYCFIWILNFDVVFSEFIFLTCLFYFMWVLFSCSCYGFVFRYHVPFCFFFLNLVFSEIHIKREKNYSKITKFVHKFIQR